jgi:hypothetical protein
MEHFKRFAFCMLYLFTFIWQLSAQVKKIPQWGAVRDSVARYCQRNLISDVAGDNINKKPLLLQWFFRVGMRRLATCFSSFSSILLLFV